MAKHIPAQTRPAYHSEYDPEMKYSDELLKSLLSVNEMYINRAAACCLMPQFLIHRVLKRYNDGRKIVCFDSYILAQEEKLLLQKIANAMGVSYTACFNRIKELDLFEMHPIEEYIHKDLQVGGAY